MRTARQRKRRSFIGRLVKGIVIVAAIYVMQGRMLYLANVPGRELTATPANIADNVKTKSL